MAQGSIRKHERDSGIRYEVVVDLGTDPMTGKTEWGQRSMQDDPKSTSWGGQNVFDVYTQSQDTALDGTKYIEW